jgi:hypothetical protein
LVLYFALISEVLLMILVLSLFISRMKWIDKNITNNIKEHLFIITIYGILIGKIAFDITKILLKLYKI